MSAVQHLIMQLRERGVEFRLENEELRFRAPKGVLTSIDMDALKAQKEGIIEFLNSEAPTPLSAPGPQPREGNLPLILTQETWWLLEKFGVFGGAALNVSKALRLRFAVDGSVLERCFREIVARHEGLRANIVVIDEKPVQIIGEGGGEILHHIDLSQVPDADREAAARRAVDQLARTTHDPAKDPALAVSLIKLGEDDFILVTIVQHIMADGWSLNVLYDELFQLYIAFSQGHPSPLAALPLQCADYALWQRNAFETLLAKQLPYWRERVAGSQLLLLPTTKPRPAVRDYRPGVICFTVGREEAEAVREMARQQQSTVFIVLLTVYMALLSRWSGQDDVLISTPFAGRNRPEVQRLIGCFLSSLIIRADLSGDQLFSQLMREVRKTTFAAYANSDIEILMLSQQLGMRFSDISINFNVENPLSDELIQAVAGTAKSSKGMPSISNFPVEYQLHWDKYPAEIGLEIVERDGVFASYLLYAADTFEPEAMARFTQCFQAVLSEVARNPDVRVSALPFGRA